MRALLHRLHALTVLLALVTGGSALAVQPATSGPTGKVKGNVSGLLGSPALITLVSDSLIRTTVPDSKGAFAFDAVPDGKFFVKAQSNGYALGAAQTVVVAKGLAAPVSVEFKAAALDKNSFSYEWISDGTRGGYETSAAINRPPVIEFLNETVTPSDASAAPTLRDVYGIILSNEQAAWTQEHATRLLAVMRSIPQTTNLEMPRTPSKWILSNEGLTDDIQIVRSAAGDVVTVAEASMVNATPRVGTLDGVRGRFSSKRLHHALVRYVTDDGRNADAAERILNQRFGVSINGIDYAALTATTTRDDWRAFAAFKPAELIELINMMEEMPSGFHQVAGLKYLVRRAYGRGIPDCACAAVARTANGYIEFQDGAFDDLPFTQHTILHEKTHFLWSGLFDDKLKRAWVELGGWYENRADPNGWSTTKTTEFVTPYAHLKNPNEDMAESVAAFILQPDLLRSRSPAKYAFIRDYIMQGSAYIAAYRPELQFEVYNLAPDYDYPGKIRRVLVKVTGAPHDDKVVTIELELTPVPGEADQQRTSMAYLTLFSNGKTCNELWLYGSPDRRNVLVGTLTLSKYAKAGYWTTDQIRVIDPVGNTRYEGVEDFGWKMYVDNPSEDTVAPTYVPGSVAAANLPPALFNGVMMQRAQVTYRVEDNAPLSDTLLTRELCCQMSAQLVEKTSGNAMAVFGKYDSKTKTVTTIFHFSEFAPNGQYAVDGLSFKDDAGNRGFKYFSEKPGDEPPLYINISSANPDGAVPELDLNRISIKATPTNAASPNGETKVSMTIWARDDKSGIRDLRWVLADPQGINHHFFFQDESWKTPAPASAAGVWRSYQVSTVLPPGSAPGKWSLAWVEMIDHAGNDKFYSLTELIRFDLER